MRWIAVKRGSIWLLQGDDAARPGQADGLREKPFRISRSACDKPHVNEIKSAGGQVRTVSVAQPKLDIVRRAPPRMFQKCDVLVEADHLASGSYPRTEEIGYATRSAANIDTTPSLHWPEPVQHRDRIRCHRPRLDLEAFDFPGMVFDRVISRENIAHRVMLHASRTKSINPDGSPPGTQVPLCGRCQGYKDTILGVREPRDPPIHLSLPCAGVRAPPCSSLAPRFRPSRVC